MTNHEAHVKESWEHPRLRGHYTPEQTSARIEASKEEGRKLRNRPVRSSTDFGRLCADARSWDDRNKGLITAHFCDPRYLHDYEDVAILAPYHPGQWVEHLEDVRVTIAYKMKALSSLLRRLR